MRKLLNKPWFVGVLALVAVAFVWNALRDQRASHPRRRASAAAAAIAPEEEETTATDAAPATLREALLALPIPAHPADPFAPRASDVAGDANAATPAQPDFVETVHLSAIWAQHGETLLLINDRICRAGDVIGRLKIESATLDGAWLVHWKGRDFVRLGGDFTLVTPAAHQPEKSTLALNER